MEENRSGLTDMMMVAFSKGEKLFKDMVPKDRMAAGTMAL